MSSSSRSGFCPFNCSSSTTSSNEWSMYLAGVSSLPLIGQSVVSRFWARLLIAVSTMIDEANALRTSSHSLAVAFIGGCEISELIGRLLHDLTREFAVVADHVV